MSRTFQDHDFLVWEVYPTTGGSHDTAEQAQLVFHCLTNRSIRPRRTAGGGDVAAAERRVVEASDAELLGLLEGAQDIP
jgi:hypothetical protein